MDKNKLAQPKPTRHEAVERILTQLPTMERRALLKLWHDLFGRIPSPDLYRTTLIPILAYRIQEKAYGGLKESTRKRLRELAEDHANGKKSVAQAMIRPKIGTRYVREYGGKLHEVTVLEAGYEYQGQVHRSLTEVAKVITGTKWSGPVFFGYKRPGKRAHA
jgi:Protein of unknown function (DUF2924)